MAADFSAGNLGVYNSSTQTWSAANVAPAFWINMESGGATETTGTTYTITYVYKAGDVTYNETMPTSYTRGSSADEIISIKTPGRTILASVIGTTSGTNYTSLCLEGNNTCSIPITVAEDITITYDSTTG